MSNTKTASARNRNPWSGFTAWRTPRWQGLLLTPLVICLMVPPLSAWAAGQAPVETVAVMAPLFMTNPSEMQAFENLLHQAADIGVNAVTVDVWWGVVEAAGDQQFDWSYYDTVF